MSDGYSILKLLKEKQFGAFRDITDEMIEDSGLGVDGKKILYSVRGNLWTIQDDLYGTGMKFLAWYAVKDVLASLEAIESQESHG
ncbi:hypothetical protein LCGC14_0298240 [marine sediment metagenome]|uniref:Uncharacterized protein n=1 Tax=marine sediment metagenome TaxID=412755 RepID=A0A0F9TW74_9ZZZZ